MQQRRLQLGDILDDYCPRERRITNHAVVAMIDEQVKKTRCFTCDAEHEYRAAKVPPLRKKRSDAVIGDPADGLLRSPKRTGDVEPLEEEPTVDDGTSDSYETLSPPDDAIADAAPVAAADAAAEADVDEGPVHRRLIRATLPRPDGQSPERRSPDFTVGQPGGRGGREPDGNKAGPRFAQGRRHGHAQGGSQAQRSGGQRGGSGSGGAGNPGGPRGNRSGQGSGRGGRKRGR